MIEIIALLCLAGAVIILYVLSVIDLEEGLLPNEFVMGFAVLGVVFHLCTIFAFLSISEMLLGAFIGGAMLLAIRTAANLFHMQDALGLGDVKLMGAAGLWLGPYHILAALIVGACAGILHGLGTVFYIRRQTGQIPPVTTLSLPAGPGFAIGIVLTGIYTFRHFPGLLPWP